MPSSPALRETLQALCPDVAPAAAGEFLSRMDEDYFGRFQPREIAAHLKLAAGLGPGQPVQLEITPRGDGLFDVVVVAFDYFGEFALLAGLLAAHGLDIRSGRVYTFARQAAGAPRPPLRPGERRRAAPFSPAKIVDVFRVRVAHGCSFGAAEQEALRRELQELGALLSSGRAEEARERLGRRVVEHLARVRRRFTGRFEPVEVRFRNEPSAAWTVIDVRAKDTPGFLYAFSNALALRGIYIHKVQIDSVGEEARDRFHVADRHGRRIEDRREREALRRAVVLIKQFTHFLPHAPDPARAVRYFDQLLDRLMEPGAGGAPETRLLSEEKGLDLLAQLLGSSEFLWEEFLRNDLENLLPLLEELRGRPLVRGRDALAADLRRRLAGAGGHEERRQALNAFKDRELFLAQLKQIQEPRAELQAFSEALTELAEVVLEGALAIAWQRTVEEHGEPAGTDGRAWAFAACGLGKLGGRELGFASDIEVCFLCEGSGATRGARPLPADLFFEHVARGILELIEARQEGAFELDLRLRPHGKAGPLASPWPAWRAYYDDGGEAAPFERQALIKLRWVAGDAELGRRALEQRDRFVYSGRPWDRADALHLRRRQERELVEPGALNVKYSPGGLVDVEYAVQYLQILHGHLHPELRTPNTREALHGLHRRRILSGDEHGRLDAAYTFLRRLIDALRMVKGNARDLVVPPEDSDAFRSLARRMGYRERDWATASRHLARDLHGHMHNARAIFSARFGGAPRPAAQPVEG